MEQDEENNTSSEISPQNYLLNAIDLELNFKYRL